MGQPAAKQGDKVVGVDVHVVVSPAGVAAPAPSPFNGMLTGGLSNDVKIDGMPAAVVGSTANNVPPHIPAGGTFQKQPSNQGKVLKGSPTVNINGKPAARAGDTVQTCNDPSDLPAGTITAAGTVMIG